MLKNSVVQLTQLEKLHYTLVHLSILFIHTQSNHKVKHAFYVYCEHNNSKPASSVYILPYWCLVRTILECTPMCTYTVVRDDIIDIILIIIMLIGNYTETYF